MRVEVTSVTGLDDAINSMSIIDWSWEQFQYVKGLVALNTAYDGSLIKYNDELDYLTTDLLECGRIHIRQLRFIDIAIMTKGYFRLGHDDVDSYVSQFDNRIIRFPSESITACPEEDYFRRQFDKYITTVSPLFSYTGKCRDVNTLAYPENFICKINLCEWARLYQECYIKGEINPETKLWAEEVMSQITEFIPQVTKDYILSVEC